MADALKPAFIFFKKAETIAIKKRFFYSLKADSGDIGASFNKNYFLFFT